MTRIRFPILPPVGLAVQLDDQFYVVTAARRKKGAGADDQGGVVTWQSDCAECGEAFTTITAGGKFEPSRRCKEHRRPGLKVCS